MKRNVTIWLAAAVCCAAMNAAPAFSATVKVTPLGGIDGEFCPQDRALVFEHPNGTRVLYDPGRTVAGATDPRLGKIDIILVSHMHGDHVGGVDPAYIGGELGKAMGEAGIAGDVGLATGYVRKFSNGLTA